MLVTYALGLPNRTGFIQRKTRDLNLGLPAQGLHLWDLADTHVMGLEVLVTQDLAQDELLVAT